MKIYVNKKDAKKLTVMDISSIEERNFILTSNPVKKIKVNSIEQHDKELLREFAEELYKKVEEEMRLRDKSYLLFMINKLLKERGME